MITFGTYEFNMEVGVDGEALRVHITQRERQTPWSSVESGAGFSIDLQDPQSREKLEQLAKMLNNLLEKG
jgi:hypothetical protein